jgi:hypothetical protein|tara:strand:+ start:2273 stop:2509 length:237 start_codon:yes stop_codon:yes gene_type:complete
MLLGINDLSEEDYDAVVEFSQDIGNLDKRYLIACSIITSLMAQQLPEMFNEEDSVDLSICKMLMDGVVEIEQINTSIH